MLCEESLQLHHHESVYDICTWEKQVHPASLPLCWGWEEEAPALWELLGSG